MEDSDDLEAVASQPIGNDVRCAWRDQFSGAGDAARTTEIGQFSEALAAGGAEAKRAFEAMMSMKKIDVATVDAARRG